MNTKNTLTDEEKERILAIDLYKRSCKVSDICVELNRTRAWFYNWMTRYKKGSSDWYKTKSKVPKLIVNKTNSEIEKLIISIRKELINTKFSQYGAQAILYELKRKGYQTPTIRTINRILKRNNLINKSNKTGYISKGKEYPYSFCACQQMDFVGPRYQLYN